MKEAQGYRLPVSNGFSDGCELSESLEDYMMENNHLKDSPVEKL